MTPYIRGLLQALKTGTVDEKMSLLIDLGDYIEFEHAAADDLIEIVQTLITRIAVEMDPKLQRALFRNAVMAYMQPEDLSPVKFDAVIARMRHGDSYFICSVLYLMSMTYKKEYIPIISEYLSHPDEKVREEAESALNYLPG